MSQTEKQVIKVIWHKATSLQTDGSITFAPMCLHRKAHWRHSANVLPSVHQSPQPKWQINQFSHFCTAHGRVSMGMSFPLIIAPSHEWSGPHLIHASLGPVESITQTVSRSVQPFLHRSRQSVAILYNGPPLSPLKLQIPKGDLGSHLTRDSLGPSEPTIQTASRSVQPFFSGLTSMTARQIDRPWYSVCNNRPHLRLWRGQIKWHV